MRQKPKTLSVPHYAYKITVNNKVIGTLQGFNPSFDRVLEPVREVCSLEDISEIVPGKGSFVIGIDRIEIYDNNFGQVLTGSIEDVVPSNQFIPFNIIEQIYDNNNVLVRQITYMNCWIQNYRKTITVGSVVIAESVTVQCEKVVVSRGNR